MCDKKGKTIGQLFLSLNNPSLYQEWSRAAEILDVSCLDEFAEGEKHLQPLEKAVPSLPEEFISFSSGRGRNFDKAKRYLKGRGLTDYEILFYRLGFCDDGEYFGRIIIPSFDFSGELNFFTTRTFREEDPRRYKNPVLNRDIIFNGLLLDFDKPLFITEGVFDGIRFDNFLPLLGSSISPRSLIFNFLSSYPQPLYFAMDPDAWEKEQKIMKSLLAFDKRIFKVDVSGFKDVGEMTVEQARARAEKATLVDREFLLASRLEHVLD